MVKNQPITVLMSDNPITLNSDDDLTTAEELFKLHKIRHIPIVQGRKVIGMLSHTDLLRVSYKDSIEEFETEFDTVLNSKFTIEQVMTKNVVAVNTKTTIEEVATILSEREFHALPVLENDELIGIITTTDLVHFLLRQ
jgi:CBS domain-containing membrane protein